MVDSHTKKDIQNISLDILRKSKSLDVFPTPVDQIVEYSELIVRNDIDISVIHNNYLFKATDALKRAVKKVRGLLDREEKTIFLDLSQKKERKNFVKLHETAHGVLPWQVDIHDVIDDDDESLRPDVHESFEDEANYFATITLFQHDRFIDELNKLSLGIESPMQLAKIFGSSVHAALRRYVECSSKRCALLVLENFAKKSEQPKCTIRNKFQSNKFSKHFGEIALPDAFGSDCEFVKDYYLNRRYKTDGVVDFLTGNGNVTFNYHYFNNTYNAFIFLFPIGEKKSSRTKIIVSNSDII